MRYRKYIVFLLIATAYYVYLKIYLSRSYVLPPNQVHTAYIGRMKLSDTLDISPIKRIPTVIKNGVTEKMPYLLENPFLCTSVTNLTVLIIVHTAPSHHERRQTMRQTWANNSYYSNLGSVRILFLLGAVKNIILQAAIEKEFRQHADILQGGFIDSYHNLTYKGIMAYKWLTEKCRNAKLILKVDDDVIVNMFYFLTKYTPQLLAKKKYMSCHRLYKSKIVRRHNSTWYVNESFLSNKTVYPDYCQGIFVIMSNDLVPALYESVAETPFLWVDDVYLYGLLPSNIPGIQYKHLVKGKEIVIGADTAAECYEDKKEKCPYLVMMFRANVTKQMKDIWWLIVQNYRNTSTQLQRVNVPNQYPMKTKRPD